MTVWTEDQLTRWALQSEEKFTQTYDCLIDRLPLRIITSSSLYVLPDNVVNIRRITYKGTKLDPISHRDQREWLDGENPQAEPTNYIYDNQGQNILKLFPTPNEDIIPELYIDLFNPDVIRTQCIVEFFTVADGIEWQLPAYIRNKILKVGTSRLAYLAEGKGQNIKASKYYKEKEKLLTELYGDQLIDQLNTPRRLIETDFYGVMPASPVLPRDRFGVGVDF